MLLEFGFRNFFSFREGARVSLRLDSNCPANIAEGRDFATVLAVKGANAAGKTHVLKALSFVSQFAARSFHSEPGSLIALSSFFDNAEPTELYVEFRTKSGVEYRYELELDDRVVRRETIYRTLKRRTAVIERIGDKITKPKSMVNLGGMIIRDNVSVVSTFDQYGRKELSDIHEFFSQISSNVGFLGYNDISIDLKRAATLLHSRPSLLKFVKEFIKECDTGVEDIVIHEQKRKNELGAEKEKVEHIAAFYHLVDSKKKFLLIDSQSSGTKALFRVLGLYSQALELGSIVVHDEFDLHLHQHIIPKIIHLFTDPEINPRGAQLLVSSHDDRIMDLLGRYRTILVNKEQNESYLYRIDEFPGDLVRNDRSMIAAYHEGKLGGVPHL